MSGARQHFRKNSRNSIVKEFCLCTFSAIYCNFQCLVQRANLNPGPVCCQEHCTYSNFEEQLLREPANKCQSAANWMLVVCQPTVASQASVCLVTAQYQKQLGECLLLLTCLLTIITLLSNGFLIVRWWVWGALLHNGRATLYIHELALMVKQKR